MRGGQSFPAAAFGEAWRQVLLWHEHTWGAADSISQPDRQGCGGPVGLQARLRRRGRQAVEGAARAGQVADAAGQASRLPSGAASIPSSFHVINTLSFPRSGVVMLPAAATAGRDRVIDASGRGRARPSGWPTEGSRCSCRFRPTRQSGSGTLPARRRLSSSTCPRWSPAATSLNNGLVRVELDPATGDISGLTSWATGPAPAGEEGRRTERVSLRARPRPGRRGRRPARPRSRSSIAARWSPRSRSRAPRPARRAWCGACR